MTADGEECFVCRKHRDRGMLMPGGPVAEDDLVLEPQARRGGAKDIEALVRELHVYLASE